MIELLQFNMRDIFRLADLEKQCFGCEAWSINNLRSEMQNSYSYFYVQRNGEDIVGYACVRIMLEEAQICNIAVSPQFRRQGIATQLVLALLDCARQKGAEVAELEVNVLNQAAIALYQKCGFEIVGKRPKFYRRSRFDSKDAYTMTISLPQHVEV